MFVEAYVPGNSGLHRLDPRLKIIGVLITIGIIAASPPRHTLSFCAQALMLGCLPVWARIPFRALQRPLLASAVFGALAAAGCLIGAPMLPTLLAAGRLALSIFAFAIFLCITPFPHIAASLQWMKVPSVFVTVLFLAERYVHILENEAGRMIRAARARAPYPLKWRAPRVYAHISMGLLARALDRSEEVALALVSRGFTGEFPHPPLPRVRPQEGIGLVGWVTLFGAVTWIA